MLPAALRPLRRIPLARLRSRLLSSSASGEGGPPAVASTDEAVRAAKLREEAYKQVANLDWSSNADFWKAVDIVKTLPPKRKEFGLDFHLVQLFFVCLPSLAVYLVAQYARSEIKRMEAEAEEKKKKDEELEKEKQLEADSVKDETDSKLSAVLVRLDTLEGVVNEIVDDKRKGSAPGFSNKEEATKKGERQSNSTDGQVVPVKSKDIINGATNASPNSTQQSPTGNGDKASSDPKG
ncbi:uncharacterized protein [Oryza sativa Japonica Group]|uniref:Os08g0278100 protein n=5 Tax=Oryza TaxID=4527 RepID=B9G017_ORYSJ|nr:uncharacterized protein LOC4345158 [Oryza sativa Japonica Group]EEC83252.1 hypothetical protein OsI_28574 [Oryza sativa Indica Group]EEE68384.1 hypothetical protein OsJ_26714 [Oryza sativa Japonica Group]KAF2918961.1 hypothetical protein DAI22_08g098900 [Oryza sativa Japonica Group]BAC99746.1 unknown protein [Oryza sativa Japonica Group]BAF23351.1 Os08g0278100 [Oryza sativa Japonica Group]|eukprot:NP_001061437.1 Os08g0278100 [Oryza sativa Japonica Group]